MLLSYFNYLCIFVRELLCSKKTDRSNNILRGTEQGTPYSYKNPSNPLIESIGAVTRKYVFINQYSQLASAREVKELLRKESLYHALIDLIQHVPPIFF